LLLTEGVKSIKMLIMTENTTITKRELSSIIRNELAVLKEFFQVNDLVNRDEAIKILGITSKSFTTYISDGRVNVASTNAAGGKFFSRKELLGLSQKLNNKKQKT
jgi:hypothetical protein